MKNKIVIIFFVFISIISYAQNEVDALRYSQSQNFGTARLLGMGGAFNACGGDISALSINPGGLGIYRSSEISFSPTLTFNNTNASLGGNENNDLKYAFIPGNIGAVKTWMLSDNSTKQDWRGLQFAFSYQRTHQFSRNIFAEGINFVSSMLDYYTWQANQGNIDTLFTGTDLIYYDSASQSYISDFNNTNYGQTQQVTLNQSGGGGQYSFAFGANYADLIYCGTSINFHHVYYNENTLFSESDRNNNIPYFNYFDYRQKLTTSGEGFSMNFGMIVRPTDWVRIGIAYQTPVFYSFEDKYTREAEANITYQEGTFTNKKTIRFLPYRWSLTTPFVTRTGIAFTLFKTAIISIDADFLNYSTARLESDDYNFNAENQSVSKRYRNTFNLRAGGEYRFGPFQLRAGYMHYGNPYAAGEPNKNEKNHAVSFGLGLRDKNMSIDFAWIHQLNTEKYYAYGFESSRIDFQSINNQVVATLGFRF